MGEIEDFNRIPGFIRHFRPAIMDEAKEATEETFEHMIDNWEKGIDSQNNAWEPLAPSTIRQKGHDDILIDTETMIDSAGHEVDRDNMTAEIYVEDPKILFHEFGTERIPKRPVLGPTHPVLVENIEDGIEEGIDTALQRAVISGGSINVFNYGL